MKRLLALTCVLGTITTANAIPTPRTTVLLKEIQTWEKQKKTDFSSLISQWEKKYSHQATLPLFELGLSKKNSEHERALALLSSLKLSNAHQKPLLKTKVDSLYKEKSWILRSTALKIDTQINPDRALKNAEQLVIDDPALVIRIQAAELLGTLSRTKTDTRSVVLLKAIRDSKNYRPEGYRNGRSDGVSEAAFASLRKLKDKKVIADLREISKDARDPRIRAHALYTIKKLKN